MALLSATQGTPERVLALLNILAAHEEPMERTAVAAWLNPRFLDAGEHAKDEKSAVDQTIQAANGLGFLDLSQRGTVRLLSSDVPSDYLEFSDLVHERLAGMNPDSADAVVLEAFAWQAVQIEIEGGTEWINDWTSEDFAHKADQALCPVGWKGETRFNSTKRAPWRRWIEFVGLQSTILPNKTYPYVTSRLERELRRSRLPRDSEIPAQDFMSAIATRLPYLDGGTLFQKFADRSGHTRQPGAVSRLLSTALRDLQDEGKISLVVRGDSSDNYQLTADPFSKARSFSGVVIKPEVSQ